MKRKSVLVCTIMAAFALLLNSASAQPAAETVPPGPPGLSFRYLRTIGTTGDPYNTGDGGDDYLNAPSGIGFDGIGNLYVTEGEGMRVLRYDSLQHADLILGSPGYYPVHLDNSHFGWPADVLAEADGDFWVSDEYRITRWDSNGVRELSFPENPNPWCDPAGYLFCA